MIEENIEDLVVERPMVDRLFDPDILPATPVDGGRTLAPGWNWHDVEAECNLTPWSGPPDLDLDGIAEAVFVRLRERGFRSVSVQWDRTSGDTEFMPYTARGVAGGRSEEEVEHALHAEMHYILQDNDRWRDCQGLEIDEETT